MRTQPANRALIVVTAPAGVRAGIIVVIVSGVP